MVATHLGIAHGHGKGRQQRSDLQSARGHGLFRTPKNKASMITSSRLRELLLSLAHKLG
jgi:hypothetical protein